jgi:hypothetical protein
MFLVYDKQLILTASTFLTYESFLKKASTFASPDERISSKSRAGNRKMFFKMVYACVKLFISQQLTKAAKSQDNFSLLVIFPSFSRRLRSAGPLDPFALLLQRRPVLPTEAGTQAI